MTKDDDDQGELLEQPADAVDGTTSTPDPSTVQGTPGREQDDPELRDWLERGGDEAAQLRDRELRDGQRVSASTAGLWAVYDNHELRFVAGGRTHADRADAQRELDDLRPTTGHDLVIVEV